MDSGWFFDIFKDSNHIYLKFKSKFNEMWKSEGNPYDPIIFNRKFGATNKLQRNPRPKILSNSFGFAQWNSTVFSR